MACTVAALPELMVTRRRLAPVQHLTRRLAIGALMLLTITSTAACSVGAAPQLTDRVFLSVNVTDGGAPHALVAGTRIRLTFQTDNLGAQAGCNSIGGTWRLENGKLVFEGGAMTEMGCDPERHAQDDWLVELLGSRPDITLAGDELTLTSGSVVVRLLDRKVVEPDLALTGPTWTVVSIITGDAVASIPDGVVATLVFAADGSVSVHPGCNQGGGRWAAVGAGIEFSEIMLTKMACGGAAGQLEGAVLAVLGAGTVAASIEANTLTLQAGGNGLQLRAP